MIRKLGSLLIFGGFIALIYTAYNYFNNMESFEFLGTDFVISKGDPTGMVIAGGVLTLGLIINYIRS